MVFLILMWAENADKNMQRKKQFAKFRMLQIEEGKHVYVIYTFVTLTFRTEVMCVDSRYNNNNFGQALDTGGVTLCLL